jgi:hypothetical protein
MMPTHTGTTEGELYVVYEARECWIWRFDATPPRFTVQNVVKGVSPYANYFGQQPQNTSLEIATGMTREDAAQMAGLLLRSPVSFGVMLVEEPKPGKWVRDAEQERVMFPVEAVHG